MKAKLAAVISTWFGCGYFPIAPGTVASAAAVAISVVFERWRHWGPLSNFLLALVLLGPAIWAAGVAAQRSGSKDPGIVVVDEVVGQWIALCGALALHWKAALF